MKILLKFCSSLFSKRFLTPYEASVNTLQVESFKKNLLDDVVNILNDKTECNNITGTGSDKIKSNIETLLNVIRRS